MFQLTRKAYQELAVLRMGVPKVGARLSHTITGANQARKEISVPTIFHNLTVTIFMNAEDYERRTSVRLLTVRY